MAMIIAEAGTGHYGVDVERVDFAIRLVKAAAECGADYVKFQMFVVDEELFCPMEGDEKRWERWVHTFMSPYQWEVVASKCKRHGIGFLASAFQYGAVDILKELKPDYYKVASRAAKTYPYDRVPGPFIISDGMMPAGFPAGSDVLECVMEYPTAIEKARWKGHLSQGLSDHSGTPWPAIDALARGAEIVEVHFRVNDEPSPDLSSSLDLDQLKLVCEARDAFAKMR